jgi:hypothetical protein
MNAMPSSSGTIHKDTPKRTMKSKNTKSNDDEEDEEEGNDDEQDFGNYNTIFFWNSLENITYNNLFK